MKYLSKTQNFYELMLKLNSLNLTQIPLLKKITLILDFKKLSISKDNLIDFYTIFQLITKQKAIFCRSNKTILHFNIQKNQIQAFKVILHKYPMYTFLLYFIAFVTPKYPFFQKYNYQYKNKNIIFSFYNFNLFDEISFNYNLLQKNIFPKLRIVLHTTTKNKKEALIFCKNLQIPF